VGTKPNVLITGASGLVGSKVLETMALHRERFGILVALDIRPAAKRARKEGIEYVIGDIGDPQMESLFHQHNISCVVHLAAIVSPGNDSSAKMEYRVDVLGTQNIVQCAIAADVRQIITLSSGAAYGYHASNPVPLKEDDPLRGNEDFAYSRHKRLVEEFLAKTRKSNPELRQLILRPGTILGPHVKSPVSAIFEGPVVIGIAGADTPFVMILVDDVAAIIVKGILENREGIYNLAGDGALPLRQIAKQVGKPYVPVPAWLLKGILRTLKAVKLSVRGPEGVDFLRFRPVLANDRLKNEFGFIPTMTSAEVFECYLCAMTQGRNKP
jgi:UDP-glucose 4-epimerase